MKLIGLNAFMPASYIPVRNCNIITNHTQLHKIPNNRAIQNLKAFLLQKMEYSEKGKGNDESKEKASS